MKTYYVRAEIEEGCPDYEFVIKAKSLSQAEELAKKELTTSYPDIFIGKYADRFSCGAITGKQLLNKMTIN